jgi:hypothetical protein
MRLAFRALRAEAGLRSRGFHTERGDENQRNKHGWRTHEMT